MNQFVIKFLEIPVVLQRLAPQRIYLYVYCTYHITYLCTLILRCIVYQYIYIQRPTWENNSLMFSLRQDGKRILVLITSSTLELFAYVSLKYPPIHTHIHICAFEKGHTHIWMSKRMRNSTYITKRQSRPKNSVG